MKTRIAALAFLRSGGFFIDERRITMWNIPSEERLAKIPRLYETEHIPLKDKLIHLHFFIGACDWYIAEYDGEDLFFCFAVLDNDFMNAEWGYVSFSELKDIKINGWLEIDCEIESVWEVCRAIEIDEIREANNYWNKEDQSNEVELMGLLERAALDDVLELECPDCGSILIGEPDAQRIYCHECGKVVNINNPLFAMGLI